MECIHGLDDGQCDICFPKARPEQPARTPTTRTRSTRGSSARSAPPRSTPGVAIDVGRQRIYHLTHLDNLPGIFESGGLMASAVPAVDISSPEVREARRSITVDDGGASVAAHVPFFLTPSADAWLSVREGTADPRIAVAEGVPATDFVLLVSSIGAIGDYVVTDGDAAHPLTRFFASDTDGASRTVRTLVSEGEPGRISAAEILVPTLVPLDAIDLIAVANDRGRTRVRTLTEEVEVSTRVAIHPPWFQRE